MLARSAAEKLRQGLRTFPAVLLVGPRQCGKTTLARHELAGWRFLDLERPSDLDAISLDAEGFLENVQGRLLVDEAQRFPRLFPILRSVIDAKREPGRFVLTGSAEPSLLRQAGESLAGRVAIVELTPFLATELRQHPAWLDRRWFWGGYPPVHHLTDDRQRSDWLSAYVASFVEREVPLLGFKAPPVRLKKLWQMLAHVHGNLFSLSDLARSLDLHYHTVRHYLDILESAFLIRRLQPYFANIQKRLVKSPKIYIRDTGILHYMAGLRAPQELEAWPGRGSSWEGLVVEELIQLFSMRFPSPEFYFWRTQRGAEVDLLVTVGLRKIPIEIKCGRSLSEQGFLGLRNCMQDLDIPKGYIVYGGEKRVRLGRGIEAVPWDEIIAQPVSFLDLVAGRSEAV